MPNRILITGFSGGLANAIGRAFAAAGDEVYGIDHRLADYRDAEGRWSQRYVRDGEHSFTHIELALTERTSLFNYVRELKPNAVINACLRPHLRGVTPFPCDDFDANAVGTINLLEAVSLFDPATPFLHLSSHLVYGDRASTIPMNETERRIDFQAPWDTGIAEDFPIDRSTHTPHGISALASDLLVQEYGRYYHVPVCTVRLSRVEVVPGLPTEIPGHLRRMVRAHLAGTEYRVFGHQGRQVHDYIDAEDVADFALAWHAQKPGTDVLNLGGGRENSCSVLEALQMLEEITGRPVQHTLLRDTRIGENVCYYTNLNLVRYHFPGWRITRPLRQMIAEIVQSEQEALALARPGPARL